MQMKDFNLQRFIEAQEGVYPVALGELKEGRKRSHWMWFIFPQLKQLGHSFNAKFYGLEGKEEAKAYLENPTLGGRLREVAKVINELPISNAREIFGGIDSVKLKSSMTLFDAVSPNDVFQSVLEKFFNGERDYHTLKLISCEE